MTMCLLTFVIGLMTLLLHESTPINVVFERNIRVFHRL